MLFIGSGCAALIYEVVWFELLRQVIGASSVSLAIVLASYMGGLFLGSWGFPRWISRAHHPLKVYAVLELGIGVIGLALLVALPLVRLIYLSADPEWFHRGHSAFIEALSSAGYDPTLGIRLGDKLRGLGLVDVGLRGAGGESGGGDKPSVLALTLERVRDRILDMDLLSNEEIDRFLADVRSPDFRAVTAIHFIAWGRRPS